VVLVTTGVVTWQAAENRLPALPFVESIVATSTPTWPLTGVPAEAIADRPALAVKIENSADARP
jgi:hypothetical protein